MRILFVCTGNTCRSPMAEAIARTFATERGLLDIMVESAGTEALDGTPASDGALRVAHEHGKNLNSHRARTLTAELVAAADVVLTMSSQHLHRAEKLGGHGKSFLLTGFASTSHSTRDVSDPFGGGLPTYRATYEELEQELRRVFDELASRGATSAGRPSPSPGGGP